MTPVAVHGCIDMDDAVIFDPLIVPAFADSSWWSRKPAFRETGIPRVPLQMLTSGQPKQRTAEEYEEQHELVETRYSQQQNKIASQEQELTELKAKVAAALKERDKREEEKKESEAKFKAYIASKDNE